MLAMDEIYQDYAEIVFRFLVSLCNDAETARELTQETFYRAIQSSNRFNGTCKVSTWLCQIAKHVWYQELDKRKRKEKFSLTNPMNNHASVEDEFCQKEDKMQLIKQVHILNETAKEVFLLRITGAFSFKEIAEVFGKNENWARVTFYRAKQKILKGRLE